MISIIIPVYNRAHLISRALDSIHNQSYPDWECLVVDDKSSDNIKEVVDKYSQNNPRFSYVINTRDKGAQGARNSGLLQAKGDWVLLFDSDNIMHPHFLETINEAIEKQGVDVCSSWSNVIDENTGKTVGAFKWSGYGSVHGNLMTGKSYFDNSSTVIRKQLLIEIGLLDESCPAFQEWDTHLRVSNNARYYTVQKCLIDYYTGAADAISSSSSKDIKGYLFILSKFKDEWTKEHKSSYLKYCAILRMKMNMVGSDDATEKAYNSLVTQMDKLYVNTIVFLLKIKSFIWKKK